jgi:hypothetical protein
MGLTHNNLGCAFKTIDDFEQSIYHLKEALMFESKIEHLGQEQMNNSCGTIVNLSSIMSRIGHHEQALGFAK